jgi:hypothetical protein
MFFLWFLLKVEDVILEFKIQHPAKSSATPSICQNCKSHMMANWLMHRNTMYGMVCF